MSFDPRFQRVNGALGIIGCSWLIHGALYVAIDRPVTGAVDLVVGVLIVSLWIAVRRGWAGVDFGHHANLALSTIGLAAASWVSGQGASTGMLYYVCIPLVAAYQDGIRGALLWAALAALAAVSVDLGMLVWAPTPEWTATTADLAFNHVFVITIVTGFGVVAYRAYAQQAVALEAARDEALRAVAAREQFFATMSHELRTPLNAVVGFGELLAEHPLDRDGRELVETIQGSGRAMLALVEDILDFSRLEQGSGATGVSLHVRRFAVRDVVREVCELFRLAAEERSTVVRAEVDDAVPTDVSGDADRLRQVLVNLVGNAVKFTDDGEVVVSVQPGDDDQLRFEVRDDGIGIPAEATPTLFEPFTQVDPSTTRRFGGAGLGLSISQRVVGLMGGRIAVESTLGEGARFWFHVALPAFEGAEPTPIRAAPSRAGAPLRVLVAEDNPVNQLVARRLLERLGHEVDVVGDGVAALEALANRSYDAFLLDLHMPRMDGVETLGAMQDRGVPEVRPLVVVLSADVSPASRAACGSADGFLSKPITLRTLRDVLADCRPGALRSTEPRAHRR